MSSSVNWLNVAGIALDIVGAIWLAKGLAFVRRTDLFEQSRYGHGSPATVAMLERHRLDAQCGLGILVVGFGMQLIAAFLPNVAWHPWWIAGCAAMVLCVAYVYYMWTRRHEDATRQTSIGSYFIKGSEK